jgi:hypothetical protein
MNFIIRVFNWLFNPVLIPDSPEIPSSLSYIAAESEIDKINIYEFGIDNVH